MFKFNPEEHQNILALSSIFGLRMLGIFMILPVFTIYANQLRGATPFLIGIALGIYGLTQILFQIPFGMLSDRYGRKPLILIGLIIFTLGSLVAGFSDSIQGIIIGRSLQGMAAIGSVILAMISDTTRPENRSPAMAFIGMSIGISFILAMLLGPIVSRWLGLSGLFWMTALLAIQSIIILLRWVPSVCASKLQEDPKSSLFSIFQNPALRPLLFGVLALHASLTAIFIKVPIAVQSFTDAGQTWRFYVPVFLLSMCIALGLILLSEKRAWFKPLFGMAILSLALSELGIFHFFSDYLGLFLSLCLFFIAFNFLEASLPSLISKLVPHNRRGLVLGAFSSAQFLGMFLGGGVGGFLDGQFNMVAVFLFCVILALVWFVWILL